MSRNLPYAGTELDLFATALTWKYYWSSFVVPLLKGDILEVGAGLGANLAILCREGIRRWVCLEPDILLCQRLNVALHRLELTRTCQVIHGTLPALSDRDSFDAILYLDVLEHIEDDAAELSQALLRLRPGGALVILVPAHRWLYTDFDRAIGHQRRYTKTTLRKSVPPALTKSLLIYLDSVGLLASVANRLLLRQALPTPGQILFWDRMLVPLSRFTDPVLGYSVGKSLLGIWRRLNP